MTKQIEGVTKTFPLPTVKGSYVKYVYIALARERFDLTSGDGYTDDWFNAL